MDNTDSEMRQPSISAQHFRHVVGHLLSGVTVLTTMLDDVRYGMTASSVTSLSAEPAMMLICVNEAVPSCSAIARSGLFAVNVLSEAHGNLARQFATAAADKFAEVQLTVGARGLPLIAGALAHIECEVIEQLTGGTHRVFFGRVVSASARAGDPLAYCRGTFGRFVPVNTA